MTTRICIAAAALVLFAGGPAAAHHSGAMFDAKRTVTLTGTVKSFEWTNPHSWLELMVPGKNGKLSQWSIELNGPATLHRQGFRADNPKKGDKITVVAYPLRDGRPGGAVVSVLLADGKLISIPST